MSSAFCKIHLVKRVFPLFVLPQIKIVVGAENGSNDFVFHYSLCVAMFHFPLLILYWVDMQNWTSIYKNSPMSHIMFIDTGIRV